MKINMLYIIHKLSQHHWCLTKKIVRYIPIQGYQPHKYIKKLFYFHLNASTNSGAYLVINDDSNKDKPSLVRWDYYQLTWLPAKINHMLMNLKVIIPGNVAEKHSQSNINNYHKENNLIKSAQNNLHSALFSNNGDLTYTDKQRVNQAKHLLQKTLKDRKWRHHQQKNVVVANIDNFATNYTRDSKIFFLVRRPNDHSDICSTQKFSYNQLNYTPNIIFNDKDCARQQAELLSHNGTTAHVTTLKSLLDKYKTLEP